jgi:hypothetical protein
MSNIQMDDAPKGRRRKKVPYHQRPLPPTTPLPTGSVTDACSYVGYVDLLLKSVTSVQDLVRACHHALSAYWQEALIHRYQETREVSDEERAWLMSQPLGIHAGHPLYKFRENLMDVAERAKPPSINEEDTLVIWGATVLKGKPFYRTVGVLLRSERLRTAIRHHPEDGLPDYFTFIRAWAEASGVKNGNTLRGLERQLAAFKLRHPLILRAGRQAPPRSYDAIGRVQFLLRGR